MSKCILNGILYLNTTRKSVCNWYSRKGRAGATGTQFVQQLFSYNPTEIRFHICMIAALSHQLCFIYARMYALVHDGSYALCNAFLGGVQTQMIKKGPRSNRYTISTLHPQCMSGYQSHSTLTSLHTLKYQRLSHVRYSKIRWCSQGSKSDSYTSLVNSLFIYIFIFNSTYKNSVCVVISLYNYFHSSVEYG